MQTSNPKHLAELYLGTAEGLNSSIMSQKAARRNWTILLCALGQNGWQNPFFHSLTYIESCQKKLNYSTVRWDRMGDKNQFFYSFTYICIYVQLFVHGVYVSGILAKTWIYLSPYVWRTNFWQPIVHIQQNIFEKLL